MADNQTDDIFEAFIDRGQKLERCMNAAGIPPMPDTGAALLRMGAAACAFVMTSEHAFGALTSAADLVYNNDVVVAPHGVPARAPLTLDFDQNNQLVARLLMVTVEALPGARTIDVIATQLFLGIVYLRGAGWSRADVDELLDAVYRDAWQRASPGDQQN